MNEKNPNKRYRRTKENVEKDLFQAAINVIGKVGFQGLTVTILLKEAKADPPVFYNRYKDMNDFVEKFVRNYDYWLNDSIVVDSKDSSGIDNIHYILHNLIDQLVDNVCMQKLLAWEMSENNFITRRTAQNRDNNSQPLLHYFGNEFKNCAIEFNPTTAILIGGIYYLIIHREVGTFNQIDFSTKEGIDLLKKTIKNMARKLFDDHNSNLQQENDVETTKINIAVRLIKNGVATHIIEDSTGLSEKRIQLLTKEVK